MLFPEVIIMQLLTIDDRYSTMPWDQIDNVVFDIGNVLLSFDPPSILRSYVPDRPDLHPALMQRIFRSPYWVMMDHGLVTNEGAFELMERGADPELIPHIRYIRDHWIEMKDVVTEGVDALKLCREKGKRTYVLSNYGTGFEYVDAKYDFFRLFDGKIISYRVRLTKPDPAIYRCLIHTYGLEPSRTLFIDDAPANVEAAIANDWQALCFNEPGKLRRFMQG